MKISHWKKTVIVELEGTIESVSVQEQPNYHRWTKHGSKYVPNERIITLYTKLETGECHSLTVREKGKERSPVHLTEAKMQKALDLCENHYTGKNITVIRMFHEKMEDYMKLTDYRAHPRCQESWEFKR